MVVAAAWIADGWIFSALEAQSGKYWIAGEWIFGPVGYGDRMTHFWIADGWIFGPVGAADMTTGFRISDGWIYGPRMELPFAKSSGPS